MTGPMFASMNASWNGRQRAGVLFSRVDPVDATTVPLSSSLTWRVSAA